MRIRRIAAFAHAPLAATDFCAFKYLLINFPLQSIPGCSGRPYDLGKMSRVFMTDNRQDQPENVVGKSMTITGQE
jgi:hypothetical protein